VHIGIEPRHHTTMRHVETGAVEARPPSASPSSVCSVISCAPGSTLPTLNTTRPARGTAPYAAGKGTIEQLTKVAATELGARGITVNAVCPGATDTDLLRSTNPAVALEQIATITPLGRLGQPADVVALLASPDGRWLTGQIIHATGDLADHHRAANELTITDWDPVSEQPIFKTAAARVNLVGAGGGNAAPVPTNTASRPVIADVPATRGGPAANADEQLTITGGV